MADILRFPLHSRSRRQNRKKVVRSDRAFGHSLDPRGCLPGRQIFASSEAADARAIQANEIGNSLVGEASMGNPVGEGHEADSVLRTRVCQAQCASDRVDSHHIPVQDMHMTVSKRKTVPPEPDFKPTFLKAWRIYLGLSQEKAGVRDRTQVGRIERGEQPYTQETLEAFADRYGVETWQLLTQDPEDKSWAQKFLFEMDPKARDELIEAAKKFRK